MPDMFRLTKHELNADLDKAISLINLTKDCINEGGTFLESRIENLWMAKHWIEGVEIKLSRSLRKRREKEE